MIESVFSLRFLLLIIAVLFVGAIYMWGSAKSKRNARIKFDPRKPRFDPPTRRRVGQANSDPAHDVRSDPAAEDANDVVITKTRPVDELPIITRDGDDNFSTPLPAHADTQIEMAFDAATIPDTVGEAGTTDETIIALYLRPPSGREFAGPAIVRAMNGVGLRYGDMNIFHHFGAGDLTTDLPLFSVANMVEPGDFDLQIIDSFATPGLTLFLRLPAPLDGAVAFELFLNTAQRLAEALSGDLYGDPQKLLDSATIDKMRLSAAPFANVG